MKRLQEINENPQAQFLGIYGRRRIGKTFLIREFFKPLAEVNFYVMGISKGTLEDQLSAFQKQLELTFYEGNPIPNLKNWSEAFKILDKQVKAVHKKGRAKNILLFFDELPWLSTPKSGLLQKIEQYWNLEWKDIPSIRLVVCGSAASWMIKNIIYAKGGLHNRLTATMKLLPFDIREVKQFLIHKDIRYSDRQLVEVYLALGGVPYYLDLLRKGFSAAQNIGLLCFGNGELSGEFKKLFSSLFEDSKNHLKIVKTLGSKSLSMTRDEIIHGTRISSGGKFSGWLQELEEAGFIEGIIPYQYKSKEIAYRVIDEYVLFYLKWIQKAPKGILAETGSDYWLRQSQTPSYKSWSGYAFENFCLKNHAHIKRALGFGAVAAQVGPWRYVSNGKTDPLSGAQIDLLFDRADQVITVCEIKYSDGPYLITKKYYNELKVKLRVFAQKTKTRKSIFLAFITPDGLVQNDYANELVSNEVTLKELV